MSFAHVVKSIDRRFHRGDYFLHHLLGHERGIEQLVATLRYNFTELPETQINILLQKLKDYCAGNKEKATDKEYLKLIIDWFLDVDDSIKKYPMSMGEYLSQKAHKLLTCIHGASFSKTLQSFNLTTSKNVELYSLPTDSKKYAGRLLDIGTGDANMAYRVGKGLNYQVTGVDIIANGAEEWGGESGRSALTKIKLIIYDGVNLKTALRKDTDDFGKLYDVIMFNHVLHHYPSFNAEIDSLKQAIGLLKPNGILLLSEHGNLLLDEDFHLQHILFDMKGLLQREIKNFEARPPVSSPPVYGRSSSWPLTTPGSKSPSDGIQKGSETKLLDESARERGSPGREVRRLDLAPADAASPLPGSTSTPNSRSDSGLDGDGLSIGAKLVIVPPTPSDAKVIESARTRVKTAEEKLKIKLAVHRSIDTYDIRKGRENYFSRPMLDKIVESLGMDGVAQGIRGKNDASQTIFTAYRKTTTTPLPVKAFEAEDVTKFHAKLATDSPGRLKLFEHMPSRSKKFTFVTRLKNR